MTPDIRNKVLDILGRIKKATCHDIKGGLDSLWAGHTQLRVMHLTNGPSGTPWTCYAFSVCSVNSCDPEKGKVEYHDTLRLAWEACQEQAGKRRWKVKPRKNVDLSDIEKQTKVLSKFFKKINLIATDLEVQVAFGPLTPYDSYNVRILLRDKGNESWSVAGHGDDALDTVKRAILQAQRNEEYEARRAEERAQAEKQWVKVTARFDGMEPGDKLDVKQLGVCTVEKINHQAADEATLRPALLDIHVATVGNSKRVIKGTARQLDYWGVRKVIPQTPLQRRVNLLKVKAQDYLEKKGFRKFGPTSGRLSVGFKGFRVTLSIEPEGSCGQDVVPSMGQIVLPSNMFYHFR